MREKKVGKAVKIQISKSWIHRVEHGRLVQARLQSEVTGCFLQKEKQPLSPAGENLITKANQKYSNTARPFAVTMTGG